MPSFVKGVKRRIRRLKQIIHAGHPHDGPETTPGTDRCLSPALHEVVGGIPCPPVTIPASPRSSTSTDTMAVAGGLMGGKEVGLSDAVASSRGSSHYSTAETAIFGDIESDRSSSLDATRPVSSQSVALDASTSTYSTASEGSEAHLPNILEAVIEPMSAPSSSTEEPQLDEQPESHPVPVAEEQSTEPVLEVTVDVAAEPEPEVSLQNDSQSQLTASPPPPESTESIPPEEEDTSDRAPGEPREEIPFTSPPPPVLVEPPVPDPFLVDDSESSDAGSEREPQAAPVTSDSQLSESMHPAEEISLAASATLPTPSQPSPAPLPSPNLNKSVPPTPAPISDDEEDEEETPEVYLPALVHPTMFLPIPNTDPLSTLLAKYITDPSLRPARDLSGEWQSRDFHTLVTTNSWRALARMARDRIVTTDPEDISLVLDLWYLRISSLARLRLTNQASAEMNNLFSVLYSLQPDFAREYLLDRLLPFELEVLHARGKYWAGDHMGYLDALWALVSKCRRKAKDALRRKGRRVAADAGGAEKEMWVERGSRVVLIIASQLIEMKDFIAATKVLAPLLSASPRPAPELQSAVARIYLQAGHLSIAAQHIAEVESHPAASQTMKDMNAAMLATAEGDWAKAAEILQGVLAREPENFAAVNNLAVVLLSQGLIKEGIDVLEKALSTSPSTVVVAEPFLFNLSTLYELRSATAAQNKRNLLIEVAKWSGDGLKTACLKMPSN